MKLFKATSSFLVFLLMLCSTTNLAFAKSPVDKIKDTIDDVAGSLKKDVDRLGDDFNAVQDYLDHYQWKGIIQGEASSGIVTLSDLRLNGHHRVTAVHRGGKIEADVASFTDPNQASTFGIYRVVIGFKGLGPQTSISNPGISAGSKVEQFTLQAPEVPGIYEIRFRTVNSLLESHAFGNWRDDHGNEPDASTTIGVVIVKE